MDANAMRIIYFEGEPFGVWVSTRADFSCAPDDLSRYMEQGRWDLVFNALYYLAGAVAEGRA